ncbi:MAG: DUF4876 domain-containing protein [Bacteroidales bacterium]|nr:DUF4876 domain-containing protein [Bacteroidales bacterium]
MKRFVYLILVFAAVAAVTGCEEKVVPLDIQIQLFSDNAPLAVAGVDVAISDASNVYTVATDAAGRARFTLLPGTYSASATFKTVEGGKRVAYNGSNPGIVVSNVMLYPSGEDAFRLELQKVESQQLVIKELYNGGCPQNGGAGSFSNDAYVIVYNNSEFEADATDLVFAFMPPYNGHAANKFYGADNTLIYADESWIPAAGAIWSFTSSVKIPAYSQVVVAIFGAVDHTATVDASVNLANASYYWMSNSGVAQYSNKKYAASDVIPTGNYLTCYPFNMGNAWTLSNSAPAFFIANMSKSENERISNDTANFDLTNGNTNVGWSVKFPKSSVIGALEVYSASNIEKSMPRFTPELNTGYVALTNKMGYSIYRNVDKEATEALAENTGKLVYGYAGGTEDVNGSTDPSGIDAEASIAAGAHIIYSQTNDSGKDFHQRKTASLKK